MQPERTATDPIAVGVPVYTRGRALELLLESIPEYVATVYVAENGPPDQRDRDAYAREWPFDLRVLDLEHDVGIGACRAAIADACSEPYLWIGDCDMQINRPDDLRVLRSVLDEHPDLGGISGWLIEGGTVRSGARNLQVEGATAIKTTAGMGDREGESVPFVRFDFIPQAGLFRTEIFDTHAYDPGMRVSEHFDFFFGHREAGEWSFASTPAVMTIHNRDIDREYRASRHGQERNDRDELRSKWGITDIQPGAKTDWAAEHEYGLAVDAFDLVKRATPPRVWLRLKRLADRAGVA